MRVSRLRTRTALLATIVAVAGVAGLDADATSARAASGGFDDLATAIARFGQADPGLFVSNMLARSGNRWIRPALRAPRYGHDSFGPSVATSLFSAPTRMEVELFNSPQDLDIAVPTDSAELQLPSELASTASSLQGIAGSAGAAFVVAGAQRDTDVLIRALPFGVSVYALFSSPHTPERIAFETNADCPTVGSELIRRLEPGTFSYEAETIGEDEEDECEAYSHTRVKPIRAPAPTDTAAAYRAEGELLALADRQAHRDQAVVAFAIRAYTAHDAAGHPVTTEMAWRDSNEGPVIRVHFGSPHVSFPVLLRLDVVTRP
jgi:hypothetical protein